MRIVFMGTPDFAVPCLERLLEDGHNVVGVFSQPDRPRGRGHHMAPPPVKVLAEKHNIPVFQPRNLRDGTALQTLQELAPDLIVVVAYGRILPPEILNLPPYGCINVHASLLPRWRGAAPIQWSIIAGDTVTGVTIMHMAEGLDTGDRILWRETPIGKEETAGELFERLSDLGADLLSETIPMLANGTAPRIPQEESLATYAPMIHSQMGEIDFTKSAQEICNLVRGVSPSPGAYTCCNGRLLKVHQAKPISGLAGQPGILLDPKRLIVGCGDGAIELLVVQPECKKPMEGCAFVCGRRLECGTQVATKRDKA